MYIKTVLNSNEKVTSGGVRTCDLKTASLLFYTCRDIKAVTAKKHNVFLDLRNLSIKKQKFSEFKLHLID